MQLLELPELLIKKGLPFAVYSFPEKSDFRIVVQNDNEIKSCPIIDIINESGYVIADFESAHTGTFRLIRPDYILNEKSNLINQLENQIKNKINEINSKMDIIEKLKNRMSNLQKRFDEINKIVDNLNNEIKNKKCINNFSYDSSLPYIISKPFEEKKRPL